MDKHELDVQNGQVIKEFRAHRGKVGGVYEGMPILLLHHRGAKTGIARVNPMTYLRLDDDSVAVFASNNAAPNNPDWYHNLQAHPGTTIEIGNRTIEVLARVAEGPERERIWTRQKKLNPLFAEFEQRTTRQIPVIVLEPR
jgi:deazaflavin-dependent oxidoreductase (nitroreductase family)